MSAHSRLVPIIILILLLPMRGDPPLWWTQGDPPVIDRAADPNPLGPANIGQAKWMAKRALDALTECDAQLAANIQERLTQAQPKPNGGTWPAILDFSVPADPIPQEWLLGQRAPLTIGQLKAIATPFYDALHSHAPQWLDGEISQTNPPGQLQLNGTKDPNDASNIYPWTTDAADDSNLSPATIAQLKAVFSLRFETLPPKPDADEDHDGLSHALETARGTNPRNPDSDGDGMTDGWEVQWGLNPLNPADATADTDGDRVTNLREFQIRTCPTGVYRIEVLPTGDNLYVHSAADDGSVLMRNASLWNPASPLELITKPDSNKQRCVIPYPAGAWNPPEVILTDLMMDGTLAPLDSLMPGGPRSNDGSIRLFQSTTGSWLMLQAPGIFLRTLAPEVTWKRVNSQGMAAGVISRQVQATADSPTHPAGDVLLDDGNQTTTIPIPDDWFLSASPPSIETISERGEILIRHLRPGTDANSRNEIHLIKPKDRSMTPIALPGLGDESIVAISSDRTIMLGSGPEAFQVSSNGSPILLANMQILSKPADQSSSLSPLSSLYSNPLSPHHVSPGGRITLSTTGANNESLALQVIPENDADHDSIPDDWETSQIAYLVAADPQRWGYLTKAGTLDPDTTYWNSPLTAAQSSANELNPGAGLLPLDQDEDQDGVADIHDADKKDGVVDWKPADEVSYAVMEVEREDYSEYASSLAPVIDERYLEPNFTASLGNSGMLLWKDVVKSISNGSTTWTPRYRVWKNGTWSPNFKSQSEEPCVTYHDLPYETDYLSDEVLQTSSPVTLLLNPCYPFSSQTAWIYPKAVCGEQIIGYGNYRDRVDGLPVWRKDGEDSHGNPNKTLRNDGAVYKTLFPVATLWQAYPPVGQTPTTWHANPLDYPNDTSYDLPISAYSFEASGACAVGSPGGAIAFLAGNMTESTRTWKIWHPPTVEGDTPYVPGEGPPAWQSPYVDVAQGRCLQINEIEDGGAVAGATWDSKSGWWTMDDRRLVVIDGGQQKELPDGSGEQPDVYGLCRLRSDMATSSRLIAAGTKLWVKRDGHWRTTKRKPTNTPIIAVANNGVLLGAHSIWRNGAEVSLNSLVAHQKTSATDPSPRFTQLEAYAMNAHGTIVALANDTLNPGPGKKTLILLIPASVAVDANRDGNITFDGNDQTTEDKPFRFWVNDDHDVKHPVDLRGTPFPCGLGQEDIADGNKDCADDKILVVRDLEDFTRLHVKLGCATEPFKTGGSMSVALEFSDTSDSPSIKVYRVKEPKGGMQFQLTNTKGEAQIADIKNNTAIGTVSAKSSLILPSDLWDTEESSNGVVHLIFEGCSAGKGKLNVVLYKGTQKQGCNDGIRMDIADIKKMYQRWNANEVDSSDVQWDVWPSSNAMQNKDSSEPASIPQTEDEKDFILFVHGWNMPKAEKRLFAETAYKRLWQIGYKGRFGAFFWPTFYGSGIELANPQNFTGSEQRAWESSPALLGLLKELNNKYPNRVHLLAHSLGNVVAAEALHKASGTIVKTYVASQAALAADAFKSNPDITAQWSSILANTFSGQSFKVPLAKPVTTPNVYRYYYKNSRDPAYSKQQYPQMGKPYMHGVGGAEKWLNYLNPEDWALGLWAFIQSQKPIASVFPASLLSTRDYKYRHFVMLDVWSFWSDERGDSSDHGLYFDSPDNTYEIFSYCAQARSNPVGRQSNTGGAFSQQINFSEYGDLHPGHSAQFLYSICEKWEYWEKLMTDCHIAHMSYAHLYAR